VLQSIWHQVNNGLEVFVVGRILEDGTVKGGTGWGAEFAKLCNKPLYVFDQVRGHWRRWNGDEWEECRAPDDHAAALHRHRHALPRAGRRARDRRAVRALVPVGRSGRRPQSATSDHSSSCTRRWLRSPSRRA
jgi:hypothetical protein